MPVAKRIKTLRESRGLSLRGLADACNVSPATLSQIEQGQTSPSVATLEKLAHGLRIPIAALFTDNEEERAVEVLNLADCPVFTLRGDAELIPLAAQRHRSSFEPIIVRLEPGGTLAEHPFLVGMESEFVWVRSGQAVLYYDGEDIEVKATQAVYYDPRHNHNWRNPYKEPCELLLIRQR